MEPPAVWSVLSIFSFKLIFCFLFFFFLLQPEPVDIHIPAIEREKHVFIVCALPGGLSVLLCSQGEEAPVLRTCFKGVQRDGELIQVRDTVLLKSGPRKKSLPYVAKISALWEEPETGRKPVRLRAWNTAVKTCADSAPSPNVCPTGELMMSLFWYYRPEHTQGGRNASVHSEVRKHSFYSLSFSWHCFCCCCCSFWIWVSPGWFQLVQWLIDPGELTVVKEVPRQFNVLWLQVNGDWWQMEQDDSWLWVSLHYSRTRCSTSKKKQQ